MLKTMEVRHALASEAITERNNVRFLCAEGHVLFE